MKKFITLILFLAAAFAERDDLENFHSIIEKVNSLQTTWKANPNFQNITISSITRLLGALQLKNELPLKVDNYISNYMIPEEFDSREQWPYCPTISQIADQSNCGSCWAVAAATVLSDRFCIATNGEFTSSFSAQELLSCCDYCGRGCGGGYLDRAWAFIRSHGLATGGDYDSSEGCQPYSFPPCDHADSGFMLPCSYLPNYDTPICKTECTNPSYGDFEFNQDHHRVKSAYLLQGEEAIQREILANGPVEATFIVYKDFPAYHSGVYQQTTWEKLGGHGVRILGWGIEDGIPYWRVANSWNSFWGDHGLFKIIRGRNECGIEGNVAAGIPDV